MENRIVPSVESMLDFESGPTVERSLIKGEKDIVPAPVERVIRPTSKSKMRSRRMVWMIRLGVTREDLIRVLVKTPFGDDDFKNKVIEPAVEKLKHINKAVQQDI